MGKAHRWYSTSIGKKLLMAVTGILLVLFNIVHMAGNLQMFAGPDQINAYAAALKSMPALLWGARLGLLAIFIVHVITAFQLKRTNFNARPVPYAVEGTVQATLSSRTMMLTGSIILLYVIGHLLHFTLGVLYPENYHLVDNKGRHDVFTMVVRGFQNPAIALTYVAAMLVLLSHLKHGIVSVFQTLGALYPKQIPFVQTLGPALAYLIVFGYISIPLGVLFGIIRPL